MIGLGLGLGVELWSVGGIAALDEMIAGKRVILPACSRSDLQTFVKWFDDPEVTIYARNAYPALSMEQEEGYYEKHINDEPHIALRHSVRESSLVNAVCSI